MLDTLIESIIERAIEKEFGVAISTPSAEALRRKVYQIRRQMIERGNDGASKLKVILSPDRAEVWVVHAARTEDQSADNREENPPDP